MTSETPSSPKKISRRKALGMAAAGTVAVGAVAAGGYGISRLFESDEEVVTEPDLVSVRIGEPVPENDPDSGLWGRGKAQAVALEGQQVIVPLKRSEALGWVRARSVHDGERIGFLLEWEHSLLSEHTIKMTDFRDACAVMLSAAEVPTVAWTMGTPDHPVTILQWKADWQKDIDEGFQDLEAAFPNATVDFYPPLVGASHPVEVSESYPQEGRNWLPGWHVGNPISQPVKTTPVERIHAEGPGTIRTLDAQLATGRGIRSGAGWRVVLAMPVSPGDGEMNIEPGKVYSLALAVWAGSDSDRGSRKSITRLGRLTVEV
jgi:hypothetical protein